MKISEVISRPFADKKRTLNVDGNGTKLYKLYKC
jgi:hypothetical protein